MAHIEYRHVGLFFVILSAAKNLFKYIEMLHVVQHDALQWHFMNAVSRAIFRHSDANRGISPRNSAAGV